MDGVFSLEKIESGDIGAGAISIGGSGGGQYLPEGW